MTRTCLPSGEKDTFSTRFWSMASRKVEKLHGDERGVSASAACEVEAMDPAARREPRTARRPPAPPAPMLMPVGENAAPMAQGSARYSMGLRCESVFSTLAAGRRERSEAPRCPAAAPVLGGFLPA